MFIQTRPWNIAITIASVGFLLASIFLEYQQHTNLAFFRPRHLLGKAFTRSFSKNSFSQTAAMTTPKRTPVYFFSHGSPDIMYDTSHPVYPQISKLGKEITQRVEPKAIVVFSAHWQASKANVIQVNTAEAEPLIYDFYGFPEHYYAETFPHKGSPEIARRVMDALGEAGIQTEGVERGLDHGVWAVFKVAFDGETNPIPSDVPIVQVSLFEDESDAASHIKLGRALEKLREEGIVIVVSGMAVHNVRHVGMAMGRPTPMPYAVSFDEGLREAVEAEPGSERDEMMVDLLKRPDARLAHPSIEHLLPIHVGVGAAGLDRGKRVWTLPQWSVSWAQYRFGEVEAQENMLILH